ncbi:hypothetical protein XdyCFBP7245_13440 [Xanthomonas dyei]|uniref:Uncharacterized protein n=1 Tax=Xanthomonas dyei TaxID=743699 RepID=A0A2S7C1L4_9XANT|nr:hypothetical protein XdyCFBP7245_13440 [Xanthomonas dyei]
MPALIQHAVIVPFGRRHIGMPGIVAFGRGQQACRLAECVARQRMTRLRQEIGQGVLAPFQRVGAVGRQGQNALIQRQRAVGRAIQATLLLGGNSLHQQGIQSDAARLQLTQPQRDRRDLRLRHLQCGCQCQRALRSGCIAGRDSGTRLHHRDHAGARQPDPRLAAIVIQRKRCGEQFAGTAAVGGTELAARQRRIATLQQLLNAGIRPHHIAQRLAQRDDAQQQTGGQHQHHAPQRTATQRRPEARRPDPARQGKHAVASILGAT